MGDALSTHGRATARAGERQAPQLAFQKGHQMLPELFRTSLVCLPLRQDVILFLMMPSHPRRVRY